MAEDKRGDLRILAVVLTTGLAVVVLGAVFGLPLIKEFFIALEPGVGLKQAALWGFGVTFVMFIVFAVVAGEGILGELEFMLAGFFLFFVIITLLIAWIF